MKNCLALIEESDFQMSMEDLQQTSPGRNCAKIEEGQLPVARLEGGNDGLMICHSNPLDCETISEKHGLGYDRTFICFDNSVLLLSTWE